jgi:hypothetical protein
VAQPLGVVDILVPGEPPEYRLPQHSDQSVPAVLASARVGKHLACQSTEAERLVEFAIDQQSGIGCDNRAAELEHQPAVEIEPERLATIHLPASPSP